MKANCLVSQFGHKLSNIITLPFIILVIVLITAKTFFYTAYSSTPIIRYHIIFCRLIFFNFVNLYIKIKCQQLFVLFFYYLLVHIVRFNRIFLIKIQIHDDVLLKIEWFDTSLIIS